MLVAATNALEVSRQWLETGREDPAENRVREQPADYAVPPGKQGLIPVDIVIKELKGRIYMDPAEVKALLKKQQDDSQDSP